MAKDINGVKVILPYVAADEILIQTLKNDYHIIKHCASKHPEDIEYNKQVRAAIKVILEYYGASVK